MSQRFFVKGIIVLHTQIWWGINGGNLYMTKVQEHKNLCKCGSGLPYEDCCGPDTPASVVYFNSRRRTELRDQLNLALGELSAYAKRYFYGWEPAARQKFFSTFRHPVRDYIWEGIFQHWFVVNYRFHDDVSPLLDFYLAEHEDKLLADYLPVFSALKESFLSVYQVLWIHDETFALRDVFSQKEYIMAREQDSYAGDLEPGSLLLARVANLAHVPLLVGPWVLFSASSRGYLKEDLQFLRANYGLTSLASFLREHADLLCGLVSDMTQGGPDTRIKTRCFSTLRMERREIVPELLARAGFSREENEGEWLKFRRYDGRGFYRVALGKGHCVVAASRLIDLYEICHVLDQGCKSELQGLRLRWLEGCPFPGGEQLVREIEKERVLEEWLTCPREDLEGMTPLQASRSRKGRNLLNYLLEKESTAGRYSTILPAGYQQVDYLKQRLGLNKRTFRRNQQAVESLVCQYRTSQELSPYPRDYVWMDQDSQRLALRAFDRYHHNPMEKYKLAWILFLWNEYSFIYRPRVVDCNAWLAALEAVFMELVGSQASPLKQWRTYGGSLLVQKKNSHRLRRHLARYPLDLEKRIKVYPVWQQMGAEEQVKSYRQVMKEIKRFSLLPHPFWNDDKNNAYSQFVYPASGVADTLESKVQETLGRCFEEYYCLDHCGANPGSLINLFWEEQAIRYPSYLRTACFNIMMSFIGAYRVARGKNGQMILADIFTDQQLLPYPSGELQLLAGDILLTRLLPAGNRVWVTGPVLSLEGNQEPLLHMFLAQLMEDMAGKDDSDFIFLKERGLRLVRAFLMVREEQARQVNSLLYRPLRLNWFVTKTDVRIIRQVLVDNVQYFMACNHDNNSFLLFDPTGENTPLGYLMAKEDGLFLVPLWGDQQMFFQAVSNIFIAEGVIFKADPVPGNHASFRALERIMLEDLAGCLSQNHKLSMRMGFPGRQGEIIDGEALVAKLNSMQSIVSSVKLDPWNEEMI